MQRAILLGVLWAASIVGLTSADAVIYCLDDNICDNVRVVAGGRQDVRKGMQKYSRASTVDFHGNLLETFIDGYELQSAQWKTLNLSYNLLTDDMFSNIRNNQLKVVDLTYNKLTTVSIPPLVTDFTAERNMLHDITIPRNNNLKKLLLPKNKFDSLGKFINLAKLMELDLSCNDLTDLNVDQLSTMPSLHTLKLARNHIHTISGSGSIGSLEYLDLSNNILTMFENSHIHFPKVQFLYLQNNKIVMWFDEDKIINSLREVNLLENDWHCPSLEKVLNRIQSKAIKGRQSQDKNCLQKYKYICCTKTDSPYSDRLIKYRKQEFKALQRGTDRREGNFTCSQYESNPCDGDDNRVYQVAGSAAQNAESLARQNVQQLEILLKQEQNAVSRLEKEVTEIDQKNQEMSKEHSDLVAYINHEYTEELPETEQTLKGKPNEEVRKLQELFSYYETENENLKRQINEEERKNQDKLNEINALQNESDDLTFRKEKLEEEVTMRNNTVNEYNTKILALQKRLNLPSTAVN